MGYVRKRHFLQAVCLLLFSLLGLGGICLIIREGVRLNLDLLPAAPRLSRDSGFYEEPFELTITAEQGADIYYTLDGSMPTAEATRYDGPITVRDIRQDNRTTDVRNVTADWLNGPSEIHDYTATVIRAAAVDQSGNAGEVVTATYFVGAQDPGDKIIVSLVADPEDLFGDDGIYVTGGEYDDWYLGGQEGPAPTPNFLKRGKEWERPAVIEFFRDQKSIFQQPAGIRIQGASMRETTNKRFSVFARKEYGNSSWFDEKLFGEKRSHSFVLRPGFMNGYIQHLVQDRDVASAESDQVYLYLNGALWSITIAQDKYSEKYFQEHYGVDKDNVVIVKGGTAESGKEEDQLLYQEMYDFLQTHDMSRDEAYDQLDQIMDIQSYIDYSCVNVYFANLDTNETKNIVCWRAREKEAVPYGDGRWRWALYDLDLENLDYGYRMEDINTFTLDTHYAGGAFNTRPMYAALKQNAVFRRQFVISFMDMVNTDFTVQRGREAMDSWVIEPPLWGMNLDWPEQFFPARTKAVTGYLAEEFGLTGSQEQITLCVNDQEAGYVTLNTITPELTDNKWSGAYFTDYPVTVTAVANAGHRFVRWESSSGALKNSGQDDTLSVQIPRGGVVLTAIFE